MGTQGPRLTLFTGKEGFEDAEELAQSLKISRIRYKNTTYTKTYENDLIDGEIVNDDPALWGEMKKIYLEIANYFVDKIPFGSTETIFDFDSIRVWKQEYTNKIYVYQGSKYKEVPDKFIEAELIGTENLPVAERLKIHQELLRHLQQKREIQESIQMAMESNKSLIN